MYKMTIDVSGTERVFMFRGPGCRSKMIKWLDDYLDRAVAEDIRAIRVWGTVGNKNEIVREWVRGIGRAASPA
jgi:hypothetical protein